VLGCKGRYDSGRIRVVRATCGTLPTASPAALQTVIVKPLVISLRANQNEFQATAQSQSFGQQEKGGECHEERRVEQTILMLSHGSGSI
jgi:hypothetical protein